MIIILSIWGCHSPSSYTNKLQYPDHFPPHIAPPARNELTSTGVALGKALFFDPALSANGNISCATCHQPELSFSDGKKLSTGHNGILLKRHTPTLINLAWSEYFFWDGGVKNLESLSFAALMNPNEMGTDLTELSKNLNAHPTYPAQFKKAFGIDSISSAYTSRAIAQYMRTLIFAQSKYDSMRQQKITFSAKERKGMAVFQNNCAACHPPPLFTDHGFHHNGIQQSYSTEDISLSTGRFRITQDSSDLGRYKTPTLRNIMLTAPYMHDGRFKSLEEVLDHYRTLDSTNRNQDQRLANLHFSSEEKKYLIAFLATLTDHAIREKSN